MRPERMGILCPLRPNPTTAGKKMQPPENVGSEAVETSKKRKASKAAVATKGPSKLAKASDPLAR